MKKHSIYIIILLVFIYNNSYKIMTSDIIISIEKVKHIDTNTEGEYDILYLNVLLTEIKKIEINIEKCKFTIYYN